MKQGIFRLIVAGFSLLLLTACQTIEQKEELDSGLRIVTSFYPVYSMVKEVSGNLNDVRMIRSGTGIHSFEPSASDIRAIYDADAFIYHSHILESWAGRLDPNLEGSTVRVLEATEGMALSRVAGLEEVEVAEGMDESNLYDPHTWLDPSLVGEEAEKIAELLAQLDPSNEESYRRNAADLKARAESLVAKYQPLFAQAKTKTFVTQHTAFSYLARRFGLTQLGIAGVSEEEPSPRRLAEIKDFVDRYQVKTIFTERGVSEKLAQSLASSTGVRLQVLDPLEADPANNLTYLENLEGVLETLVKELSK